MRARRCSHVRKSQQEMLERACSTPPAPVVTRIRGVQGCPCKTADGFARVLRTRRIVFLPQLGDPYTKHTRSGSVSGAYKSPSIAPCKRIASGGVCAQHCATHPCFARHRGASTPTPRHRQRSLRRRIPRHSTISRKTDSQHILDHGLGPQQSAKARRGRTHQ